MVRYLGVNASFDSATDIFYSSTQSISASLIFNSVKQLYYSNQLLNPEGETIQTDMNGNIIEGGATLNVHSRFDNYLQTTLSSSRYFQTSSNTGVRVLSIPSRLYGDYINPNTFYLKVTDPGDEFIYDEYVDTGEGVIYKSGSANIRGIIIYPHGIVVFPNGLTAGDGGIDYFLNNEITCSFQSSKIIYETQYKCTLRENEFNYSLNPSMFSGSGYINPLNSSSVDTSGKVLDFVTGSSFSPYITSVGLYDDDQQLLAVAKLSQPVPTSRTTDMTIVVNLDR